MEKRMLSMLDQRVSFYTYKSKKETTILFAHKPNYNVLQIESMTEISKC